MIKFFLGMLAGAVLATVLYIFILALIGAYHENEEMKKKIKEYEEKEKLNEEEAITQNKIKTPKWEQKPYEVTYRCSECKGDASWVFDDEKKRYVEFLTNFCPHCGADMRIITEGDNDEQ